MWPFSENNSEFAMRQEPELRPVNVASEQALSQGPLQQPDQQPEPAQELKSVVNVASSDRASLDIFGLGQSVAGVTVNEKTAMRLSAVNGCVRLISGSIMTLPMHLYKETPSGREKQSRHPLRRLVNLEPNPRFTASAFRQYQAKANLLRGDSFAHIVRNARGEVLQLDPFSPDDTEVETKAGQLIYYFRDGSRHFGVEQDSVLHVPGLGFDGTRSESVIGHYGRTALSAGIAADDHAARFFKEGALQKHAIELGQRIDSEAIDDLRRQWVDRYGGSGASNKPIVLASGMQIKELSLSAADAQLLETRSYSVSDIARFFGVPPHMIGHTEKSTSWGSGLEQMSIGYVVYSLMPWLIAIEQEYNRKLFPNEDYFFEFETRGLMQGDSNARAEYYKKALGGSGGPGWMSINQINRLENQPILEGEQYDKPLTWPLPKGAVVQADNKDNTNGN